MTVRTAGEGKERWSASIAAKYPLPHENNIPREWPWLVDLDRDGRSEVVVPDSGPLPPKAGFRGVRVLDGTSGQTRWVRPMRPETKAEDGLDGILDAPDLDGDGVGELVTISRFDGRNPPAARTDRRSEPERVYVDALSGRDGRVRSGAGTWTSQRTSSPGSGRAHWWGRGPDGWPLLAVPLGGRDPRQPGRAYQFLIPQSPHRACPGGFDGTRTEPGYGAEPSRGRRPGRRRPDRPLGRGRRSAPGLPR